MILAKCYFVTSYSLMFVIQIIKRSCCKWLFDRSNVVKVAERSEDNRTIPHQSPD